MLLFVLKVTRKEDYKSLVYICKCIQIDVCVQPTFRLFLSGTSQGKISQEGFIMNVNFRFFAYIEKKMFIVKYKFVFYVTTKSNDC